MDGADTGIVNVVKRDGSAEPFDARKLAGTVWRAMHAQGRRASYRHALNVASAVEIYLQRTHWTCVSGAAVFEMVVKVLRRIRFDTAADAMEEHRLWRSLRRGRTFVDHPEAHQTAWDKTWVVRLAEQGWNLSRPAARALAAQIEHTVLATTEGALSREEVLELLNSSVAEYGLVDAVPTRRA